MTEPDHDQADTRSSGSGGTLQAAWEQQAEAWAQWARMPGFDSYWRFHRDAFLGLLPAPGALTIDVGCGEGRLARDLASRGHQVVALDSSETMVRLARQAAPTMNVRLGDAAALPLADRSADLVVAFMSYQDVDDMPAAVREAARVLTADGCLCVAIVHPLNSSGAFVSTDEDAAFVIEDYLTARRYVDVVERDGLRVAFNSMHHTLQDYSRALEDAGLVVEAMREVTIDEDSIAERADRARWRRVPLFLHFRARAGRGPGGGAALPAPEPPQRA